MGKKPQASSYVKYLVIHLDNISIGLPMRTILAINLLKPMLCFANFVTMWMKLLLNQFIMLFFIPIFYMFVLNLNPKHRINLLQKKITRVISFVHCDPHTLPIFAKLNIIKFFDLISLCNCLFIYKHFTSNSPSVFSHVFFLASNTHEQNTRFASHGLLA